MTERVDISQPLHELLDRVAPDLAYDQVKRIEFTPRVVAVEFYELNANGWKFVNGDGYAAVGTRHVEVEVTT